MRPLIIAQFLLASALSLAGCAVDGSLGEGEGEGGSGDGSGGGSGGGGSGGGGNSDNGGVEPGQGGDDMPDPVVDPDGCPVGALGSVQTLKDLQGTLDPSDPEDPESPAVRTLTGRFGEVDSIEVSLYDGYGAFAESSAAPGSYPIDGDDADPATCGVCVYVYLTVGETEHSFLATSGLVELESVDGNLTGTASSLQFDELADFYTLEPDGCEASITDVAFDVALTPPG